MSSDDPLAPPRGLRNAAIIAIVFFWLPLTTIIIIVAATR